MLTPSKTTIAGFCPTVRSCDLRSKLYCRHGDRGACHRNDQSDVQLRQRACERTYARSHRSPSGGASSQVATATATQCLQKRSDRLLQLHRQASPCGVESSSTVRRCPLDTRAVTRHVPNSRISTPEPEIGRRGEMAEMIGFDEVDYGAHSGAPVPNAQS